MFDSEMRKITRPQFIIEPLQPRRLLSVDVMVDCSLNIDELLPAGEFVESESLQEPVSDIADEPAAGEELMYTTLESNLEFETPVGDGTEVIYYTMMEPQENLEDVPLENQQSGEMPEEWVYMTMVPTDDTPIDMGDGIGDGEVVYFGSEGDPNEILQSGVDTSANTELVAAPPPTQPAVFTQGQAREAVASSVLSLDSRDLLASPTDVLV
jgi:hypothetical protein